MDETQPGGGGAEKEFEEKSLEQKYTELSSEMEKQAKGGAEKSESQTELLLLRRRELLKEMIKGKGVDATVRWLADVQYEKYRDYYEGESTDSPYKNYSEDEKRIVKEGTQHEIRADEANGLIISLKFLSSEEMHFVNYSDSLNIITTKAPDEATQLKWDRGRRELYQGIIDFIQKTGVDKTKEILSDYYNYEEEIYDPNIQDLSTRAIIKKNKVKAETLVNAWLDKAEEHQHEKE